MISSIFFMQRGTVPQNTKFVYLLATACLYNGSLIRVQKYCFYHEEGKVLHDSGLSSYGMKPDDLEIELSKYLRKNEPFGSTPYIE